MTSAASGFLGIFFFFFYSFINLLSGEPRSEHHIFLPKFYDRRLNIWRYSFNKAALKDVFQKLILLQFIVETFL